MKQFSTDSSCPKSGIISIYVTNLGKYNEGELIGEWLELPASIEQIKACLSRIEIDGILYEEYFLTDYESSIFSLAQYIHEYTSIEELNNLALKLEELEPNDILLLESILEQGNDITSIADVFDVIERLEDYSLLEEVNNDYDLGYYWIEESGCYDLKQLGNLAYYIDYERFGRDIALEQGGCFTSHGYLYQC